MATFKIHEDQENRRTVMPLKDAAKNNLQPNRTILGVLDNNSKKFNNQKQPDFTNLKSKDENVYAKQPSKKPIPAVPVAQFEAFKVYEDKLEEKPEVKEEIKEKSNVATVTRPALAEVPEVSETPMSEEGGLVHISPMSIDKSLTYPAITKPAKIKQEKDVFFEMQEYRRDIHKYLREAELRNRPKAGYMKKQPDITYSMRTILVDWLVEVAEEYRLQTETLYLAVSYIDRFLSYMSVVRAKLQLVGTAAMFIASKYEEIYPPDVGEFVYITDDTYNKKQVLRMEQLILKVLAFDLSIPTPLTFLTKLCATTEQPERVLFLAMYLCELSLLDADPYLQYLPSMLAATAVFVARDALDLPSWTDDLEDASGYPARHILHCAQQLKSAFGAASNLQQQAIQEKYKTSKYLHVSMVLPRCQINNEETDDDSEEKKDTDSANSN